MYTSSIDQTLVDDGEVLANNFDYWQVEHEYYQHIISYLRFGWEPGSFYTALLANDCLGALTKSHPGNTMETLKSLAKWLINNCPEEAFGSYAKVDKWTKLTNDKRREILESKGLVKTPWQILLVQTK
jgi:hypothetical protein